MFRLYFSRDNLELIVEPIGNLMIEESKVTDVPTYFNSCYLVCNNRKALKLKAKEIWKQWYEEAEKVVTKLQKLEIKSKY